MKKILYILICGLMASLVLVSKTNASFFDDWMRLIKGLAVTTTTKAKELKKIEDSVMESKALCFGQELEFDNENQSVKDLQDFLCQNSFYKECLITGYFGGLTKKAVINFQNYYFDEILKPLGLLKATGYVGSATLKQLNKLTGCGVEKQKIDNKIDFNFNLNLEDNVEKIEDSNKQENIVPEVEKKENVNLIEAPSCNNTSPKYTLESPFYISGVVGKKLRSEVEVSLAGKVCPTPLSFKICSTKELEKNYKEESFFSVSAFANISNGFRWDLVYTCPSVGAWNVLVDVIDKNNEVFQMPVKLTCFSEKDWDFRVDEHGNFNKKALMPAIFISEITKSKTIPGFINNEGVFFYNKKLSEYDCMDSCGNIYAREEDRIDGEKSFCKGLNLLSKELKIDLYKVCVKNSGDTHVFNVGLNIHPRLVLSAVDKKFLGYSPSSLKWGYPDFKESLTDALSFKYDTYRDYKNGFRNGKCSKDEYTFEIIHSGQTRCIDVAFDLRFATDPIDSAEEKEILAIDCFSDIACTPGIVFNLLEGEKNIQSLLFINRGPNLFTQLSLEKGGGMTGRRYSSVWLTPRGIVNTKLDPRLIIESKCRDLHNKAW